MFHAHVLMRILCQNRQNKLPVTAHLQRRTKGNNKNQIQRYTVWNGSVCSIPFFFAFLSVFCPSEYRHTPSVQKTLSASEAVCHGANQRIFSAERKARIKTKYKDIRYGTAHPVPYFSFCFSKRFLPLGVFSD